MSRIAATLCRLAVLAVAPPAWAGTLTVSHAFSGGADGATPYKGLTADARGNLYGETFYGANACPDSYLYPNVGCGTIYKIDAAGTLTTLVTFAGKRNGADGNGNLTLSGSTLYGTGYVGGASDQGMLFSVSTNGRKFHVLHAFIGTDGEHPNTYPRLDAGGDIFSTTPYGGPGFNGTDKSGNGVLYELTAGGSFIPLHDFSGGADGGIPSRIFLDNAGTVFGSTIAGGGCTGTGVPANGCGVIFSYVPSTGVYTVLYTFTGGTDGFQPTIGAIDTTGNLYGATIGGGAHNYGTLFELVNSGGSYTLTTLHAFTGGADGATPQTAPTLDTRGHLVGQTLYGPVQGSSNGYGVLYSYGFGHGQLTTLYTFAGDANGGYPESTPLVLNNGTIVATTAFGGTQPCNTSTGTLISSYGCGVVYRFK